MMMTMPMAMVKSEKEKQKKTIRCAFRNKKNTVPLCVPGAVHPSLFRNALLSAGDRGQLRIRPCKATLHTCARQDCMRFDTFKFVTNWVTSGVLNSIKV